jgi:hypothetical protein
MSFTEILKKRRKSGKGVAGSIGYALTAPLLEKIDPRNILFKSGGILNALFPKVKGFTASKEKSVISKSTSGTISSSLLLEEMVKMNDKLSIIGENSVKTNVLIGKMNDGLSVIGKNSMAFSIIMRDMNVSKQALLKIAKKLTGETQRDAADRFFLKKRELESQYESEMARKKEVTKPERVVEKETKVEKEKGGISSLLGGLGGALGGIGSLLGKGKGILGTGLGILGSIGGGLIGTSIALLMRSLPRLLIGILPFLIKLLPVLAIGGALYAIGKYVSDKDFREKVNQMISDFFEKFKTYIEQFWEDFKDGMGKFFSDPEFRDAVIKSVKDAVLGWTKPTERTIDAEIKGVLENRERGRQATQNVREAEKEVEEARIFSRETVPSIKEQLRANIQKLKKDHADLTEKLQEEQKKSGDPTKKYNMPDTPAHRLLLQQIKEIEQTIKSLDEEVTRRTNESTRNLSRARMVQNNYRGFKGDLSFFGEGDVNSTPPTTPPTPISRGSSSAPAAISSELTSPRESSTRQEGKRILNSVMSSLGITDPVIRKTIERLAETESSFNPNSRGEVVLSDMHKGDRAHGLLQIMPKTAESMGYSRRDIEDPLIAATAGVEYFMRNLRRHKGDLHAAIVSHHAGPTKAIELLEDVNRMRPRTKEHFFKTTLGGTTPRFVNLSLSGGRTGATESTISTQTPTASTPETSVPNVEIPALEKDVEDMESVIENLRDTFNLIGKNLEIAEENNQILIDTFTSVKTREPSTLNSLSLTPSSIVESIVSAMKEIKISPPVVIPTTTNNVQQGGSAPVITRTTTVDEQMMKLILDN